MAERNDKKGGWQKARDTLRYLNAVSGMTKIGVFALIVLQMVQGSIGVSYALVIKNVVNAAVAGQKQPFFVAIAWFVGLVVVQLSLSALSRLLGVWTQTTLENRIRQRLFRTLLSMDYGAAAAMHSGELMHRLYADTGIVTNGITGIPANIVNIAVRLVGAIVMVVVLDPRFLFIIIPSGLLLVVFSYPFRRKMRKYYVRMREQNIKLRIFFQDVLGSLLVVRSFCVEESMTGEAGTRMATAKQLQIKSTNFGNLCSTGYRVIMEGTYILGLLFCGYAMLVHTMSYGTFMAILQLIRQAQAPFSGMSGIMPRFYALENSVSHLLAMEEKAPPLLADRYSLREITRRYAFALDGLGVDNISFRYPPPVRDEKRQMPLALHEVSLDIRKGEHVALVGPSGCGKSTLLKLLMCLYPLDEGARYVEVNGSRQPLTEQWQRLFAYVPQGNHLMSGTIREIVSFADRERKDDDAAINEALAVACADTFVGGLEKGIDSVLGERGAGLSEGQMQRLAIARAVFSGCPILMLDECTSALDDDTEQRLLQGLQQMTDKTVIIVTHRAAALAICHKVVRFAPDGTISSVTQQ